MFPSVPRPARRDVGGATSVVQNTRSTPRFGEPRGRTEGETRSGMEQSAPTRQVSSSVTPEQRVRCSQLLNFQNKEGSNHPSSYAFFRHLILRCIQCCMNTRKNVLLFPEGKGGAASSSPKHSHDWYKSLAGGFRCACESWRCEFAAGSKLCDRASEHGRRFCLSHLVSKPQ